MNAPVMSYYDDYFVVDDPKKDEYNVRSFALKIDILDYNPRNRNDLLHWCTGDGYRSTELQCNTHY